MTRALLDELLWSLSAAETSAAFAERWGAAAPDPIVPGRMRIAAPAPGVATVAIVPWEDGGVGGAEIELDAAAAPTRAELADWLGPLEQAPRLHPGPGELVAHWWRAGAPVDVAVIFHDPGETGRVERLFARRGRSAPAPPEV